MTENNPLFNPLIKEKHKLANGTKECRKKKSEYTKNNNPMFKLKARNKHREELESAINKENNE